VGGAGEEIIDERPSLRPLRSLQWGQWGMTFLSPFSSAGKITVPDIGSIQVSPFFTAFTPRVFSISTCARHSRPSPPAVGPGGCQKFGGRNHKMAAMAITSMTMAERKGVQFDCSIMDLTAISDSGGERRARGTTNCTKEGRKKLIQRKKPGRRLTFLAEIEKLS
jgi:hypothetical protein